MTLLENLLETTPEINNLRKEAKLWKTTSEDPMGDGQSPPSSYKKMWICAYAAICF